MFGGKDISWARFCYVVLATATAGSLVVSVTNRPFKWPIYIFYDSVEYSETSIQRRLADKTGSWQRFFAGLTSEQFGWWGMLGVATIAKGGHLGSSWSSRKKEKKLLVNLYCLCIVHTSINLIGNVVSSFQVICKLKIDHFIEHPIPTMSNKAIFM